MSGALNRGMYRAAIYIRLSKEDGDKPESNSISNQRDLIYAFLKDKEEIKVCEEKVDDGYSGVDFNRPAFLELLEDVRQGKIDCILVKDLSRFGRNYIETGRYIQQIFPFMGIRFIAINDNYDSARPDHQTDSILLPFKNLMNDSYSRDISIKVRSQIEVRQKRGDYIGSFPVYGYFPNRQHKGKLVIDEAAAVIVRDIFRMRLEGCSNQKIADDLNEHGVPSPMEYKLLLHWKYTTSFKVKPRAQWSAAAVGRILKNEIYAGTMAQGKETTLNYKVKKRRKVCKEDWIRVENTHEAIISREVFDTVQRLMLDDTRTAPGEKRLYLFSGLLRCGGCGCNMVRKKIRSAGREYVYYVCSGNKNDKAVCSSHRIREDFLSGSVLQVLRKHIALIGVKEELQNAISGLPLQEYEIQKRCRQVEKCRSDLIRNQKLKNSVYEDYKDALLTKKEYLEMKADYEAICEKLKNAIEILEEEISSLTEAGSRSSGSQRLEAFKTRGNISELNRGLLVTVIEKIVVTDAGHIEIHFRYRNEFEKAGEAKGYGEKEQESSAAGTAYG